MFVSFLALAVTICTTQRVCLACVATSCRCDQQACWHVRSGRWPMVVPVGAAAVRWLALLCTWHAVGQAMRSSWPAPGYVQIPVVSNNDCLCGCCPMASVLCLSGAERPFQVGTPPHQDRPRCSEQAGNCAGILVVVHDWFMWVGSKVLIVFVFQRW